MSAPSVVVGPQELTRLEHLEAIVAQGLSAFVEVGTALREIRDSRLYRETHTSFEDYVSERWSLSRTYAYDLIGSSQVVERLSTIADTRHHRTRPRAGNSCPCSGGRTQS